ncbi:MAG: helix-turn-helix domain-containing protein [Actinomycetota bacterium]|nr:helix-turn-helix domain-containing protein [Actinomycetota bacterium]
MVEQDPWRSQLTLLGEFIRTQRKLARLSLRELADMTKVSNAYLSQIERGLHQPSVRVLQSVAQALNVSAETLLAQAGLIEQVGEVRPAGVSATEITIRSDPLLTTAQKEALIGVYRSFLAED